MDNLEELRSQIRTTMDKLEELQGQIRAMSVSREAAWAKASELAQKVTAVTLEMGKAQEEVALLRKQVRQADAERRFLLSLVEVARAVPDPALGKALVTYDRYVASVVEHKRKTETF